LAGISKPTEKRNEMASATNPLIAGLVPVYAEAVKAANEIALKIKSATSGEDEKVQAVLSTSDDAELAKWREDDARVRAQIAEAQKRLDEAKAKAAERAKSLVTDESDGFNVEEGKKEFLTRRQEATSFRKTLLMLHKNDETALTKTIEDAGIVEILSLRGSSGKTSGATGKRKPRLTSASVDGVEIPSPTFTTLASKIGVDVDTLKDAAFKAAETDDLSGEKAGEEITFTVANKKSETVTVVIVPKASGARSDETESETETSESE